MLLKQRVLHALTRLGDRDTVRVAVKELTRLIATVPPEHIPVVIGCLCDEAAAAPKAVARRVRPRPRPSPSLGTPDGFQSTHPSSGDRPTA